MTAEKRLRSVPAWVNGLWMGWADWIRSDGWSGDLDRLNEISGMPVHTRTNSKGQGPVLRTVIAAEDAEHSEYALVDILYRQLTAKEKFVIFGYYVEQRNLDEITGISSSSASRYGVSASTKLRNWVLGLRLLKGDDHAAMAAVTEGRKRRLEYAGKY